MPIASREAAPGGRAWAAGSAGVAGQAPHVLSAPLTGTPQRLSLCPRMRVFPSSVRGEVVRPWASRADDLN